MERKPGFYWVRTGKRWIPAQWIGRISGWDILGWRSDLFWTDADIDEVGPALEPPVLAVEGRT